MILDFYEMLDQGSTAARADRPEEALQYPDFTARMGSENPCAWLWLAAGNNIQIPEEPFASIARH